RIMQRKHYTARADAQAARFARERRRDDRGVWRETTDGVEVAFGDPHCFKAMLVGILCSFQQQLVFIFTKLRVVVAEVIQAELWSSNWTSRCKLLCGAVNYTRRRRGCECG